MVNSELEHSNIINVSWADHLTFGEGDGRLYSQDAVRRRMEYWHKDLNAATIHWRLLRSHIKGHFSAAKGYRHPTWVQSQKIRWDYLDIIPHLAHEVGLKIFLYVSLFDEGWPLLPKKIREISYHNSMHCQHVSWQSEFSRKHPEYTIADRTGKKQQWGVLCLAYPEVRAHFCERFLKLLEGREFDGLFVCMRSQSRPADFADQYGFNEAVRSDYLTRYGKNICKEDFDLLSWRDLLGEYLTIFLAELRHSLSSQNVLLSVGIARGDILGPPLGNTTLQWRNWVMQGIIDELIINQNSSQCPSMWHQLWPMHRGYGYLQNYRDNYNIPPLLEHLNSTYAPIFMEHPVNLYIARQWDNRSETEEAKLLALPAVKGLVFSSFRHDNPKTLAKNDWRA